MRKRIWRMSEDKFDNQRPKVSFSHEKITLYGEEGSKLQDEFRIISENEVLLKGIVYSSNPYVRCVRPDFKGTEAKIKFEVLGQDYIEGDQLSGYFTIICNQGEYHLPFDVQFYAKKINCSIGEINSLHDFAVLAQGHWNEAMQLFYSKVFERFMDRQEVELRLLYQGFRKGMPSSVNLEEFLETARLKDKVFYQVEAKNTEFYEVLENRKETIEITKNTWGYVEFKVQSDCDFVTVEKEVVNNDFFLGSTMLLNFYIHRDRMHEGKNYGTITIQGKGQKHTVPIMATAAKEDVTKKWVELPKYKQLTGLTELYLEFRLRRMTTGDWAHASIEKLDFLSQMEPENTWYSLMKAQCYIANKQRQEALWIIADMKKEIADKSSVEWAYLLYLCTLIEKEASYVDRLTKEIELIFRKHPEDARIFWFLSFLREEYCQNSKRKLREVEQWMQAGHHSPFLYMEALALYLQDPYLLQSFTTESIHVLLWAERKQGISRDLAMQIAQVLEQTQAFDERIWKIALGAYQLFQEPKFFTALISYLIRNQMYDEKYLWWYKEAIERETRLNGIYEAYMMTLPESSGEALPQMLLMYFQYSCNLPDTKRALLYANVITNREKYTHIYQVYLRQMEQFAYEQMKLGRIDDNLAIVYQHILQTGIFGEEMAQVASGFVSMYKIVSFYPDIARVFVYQEQYEMPIVVPFMQDHAYIPIISSNYRIFMETKQGELLCDKEYYVLQKMLYTNGYIERLKQLAPLSLPFVLQDLEGKNILEEFKEADVPKLDICIHSSLVSRRYITTMYPQFVTFLQTHCREEILEQHFMEEVDYHSLDTKTRAFIISLFISREQYEKAYELCKIYDCLEVDERLLLRMCNEILLATDFEEDFFLLSLCGYLLAKQKYTPATISFMANHYVGPSEQMIALWSQTQTFEMRESELEENILFQCLYAESCMDEMPDIFDSYMTRGKDKMLVEAYINYWSREYMMAHEHVPEQLFTYLAYYFDREFPLKESACLAYMKYLASLPLLSGREHRELDALLDKYIRRNMYFSFYKDMDEKLIVKYQLYDKQFVEYRGNPGERILIRYQYENEEPQIEEMIEMYEGIFVKQFVLFFGEHVTYELSGEELPELTIGSGEVTITSVIDEKQKNRFALLNQMQNALIYQNTEDLAKAMKMYQGLDEVTKTLFTIV